MPSFIVKRGRHLFATGHGTECPCPIGCWTADRLRAFVFDDQAASTGPLKRARDWAEAHVSELRRKLPKRERGRVHVVAAPQILALCTTIQKEEVIRHGQTEKQKARQKQAPRAPEGS